MPYLLEGSIYWSVTIKTHRLCHLNRPNNQRCLSKQNFSGLQVTSCGYIFSELFRLPYLNHNINIIHQKLDDFINLVSSFEQLIWNLPYRVDFCNQICASSSVSFGNLDCSRIRLCMPCICFRQLSCIQGTLQHQCLPALQRLPLFWEGQ